MMRQIRFPGESPEQRRARQLRERVDTLRGAQQRIIDAADAERRRIERDLHDGAQQRMVAVAVTLGLAEAQLESDPSKAAGLMPVSWRKVSGVVSWKTTTAGRRSPFFSPSGTSR